MYWLQTLEKKRKKVEIVFRTKNRTLLTTGPRPWNGLLCYVRQSMPSHRLVGESGRPLSWGH